MHDRYIGLHDSAKRGWVGCVLKKNISISSPEKVFYGK